MSAQDDLEREPLNGSGRNESSSGLVGGVPGADAVARLRDELVDVQRKLEVAMRLKHQASDALVEDRLAGHVDVHFVRTKPGTASRVGCREAAVKTILHSFHADFPEGCVTALMGPSGAGKTTLLDFLTGMLGDSVHASGQVALPDDDAYVPQDDRLHSFYTCQQYMVHYAKLTGMLPLISFSQKSTGNDDPEEGGVAGQGGKMDVHRLIDAILSEVGLSAQKNTPVGGMFKRGLSGGQKRRLSVALEALSSPLNLFLDEPTSGLDSESALGLMTYLNAYARGRDPTTGQRRRVIVTIHQPSSHIWEKIDNVVLLAQGRLMYQGPRAKMGDFFAAYGHPVPLHYNPADHVIEALFETPDIEGANPTANTIELWAKCFRKWSNRDDDEEGESTIGPGNLSRGKSMVVRKDPVKNVLKEKTKKSTRTSLELTNRSFQNILRNPVVLGLRLVVYGGMSVLIGILFFKLVDKDGVHAVLISRTAVLYFLLAFCGSMSTVIIPFAMVERGICEKEVRNHLYHPVFYHLSQTLASLPVCLILSGIVTGIVLGMTGLKAGGAGIWFILFITFVCADALSMFVAHVSPDLISALCISAGSFSVMTLLIGFLVLPSNFPTGLGWLYYIPFMTYAFRSMMYIEFHDLDIDWLANENLDMIETPNGTTAADLGVNSTVANQLLDSIGSGTDDDGEVLPDGDGVLKFFEMENVVVKDDMVVLVIWFFCMHAVSVVYLLWQQYKSRRIFVYSGPGRPSVIAD